MLAQRYLHIRVRRRYRQPPFLRQANAAVCRRRYPPLLLHDAAEGRSTSSFNVMAGVVISVLRSSSTPPSAEGLVGSPIIAVIQTVMWQSGRSTSTFGWASSRTAQLRSTRSLRLTTMSTDMGECVLHSLLLFALTLLQP